MDRLNNITERGVDGFPVSTEVIKVLADYQDFIHAILDSLNLSAGSCVFLNHDYDAGSGGYVEIEGGEVGIQEIPNIKNAMVYIVPNNSYPGSMFGMQYYRRGKLYRLEDYEGASVAQLVSGSVQKSIQKIEKSNDVISNVSGNDGSGESEMIWKDVYKTVFARIIDMPTGGTPSLTQAYRFYTLSQLIDIDSNSVNINLPTGSNLPSGVSYDDNAARFCQKYTKTIKLAFTLNLSMGVRTGMITLPIYGAQLGIDGYTFVAAGGNKPVMCQITSNSIILSPLIDGGSMGEKVYVNHTINLK